MSDQDNGQVSTLQRPTTDDPNAWKEYWKAQGWPWRTEPEIDAERQKYLTERRAIVPDIEKGISPFKDVKLSRADVEWLLATHENGRGPVDWNDENQRNRTGLDLGGADLRNVNLSQLPLARMNGFGGSKVIDIANKVIETVIINLEGANLVYAHFEGAMLMKANLSRVNAYGARFEGACLFGVSLENARLDFSHLEKTNLILAQLQNASLKGSHLEGASIDKANLAGTILCSAFFDRATQLEDVVLNSEQSRGVTVADVRWGDVNLTAVKWSQVKILGDEHEAHEKKRDGQVKAKTTRLEEYERAVRANRQLAVALQGQGLNEIAAHFAYRAQKLQRIVFRRQKKFGQYISSSFLDLLAGYGYRPLRAIFWYFLTICTFALAYHYVWATYNLEKITHHPLSYVGAFIFSITAFHGRGFFLGGDFGYDSLITILAAVEAVIGLIIEFSFIATFTQRFFGR